MTDRILMCSGKEELRCSHLKSLEADRDQWRALAEKSADSLATERAIHDARVTELLKANTFEVERRRAAERAVLRLRERLVALQGVGFVV
jgi:hypothetical protein